MKWYILCLHSASFLVMNADVWSRLVKSNYPLCCAEAQTTWTLLLPDSAEPSFWGKKLSDAASSQQSESTLAFEGFKLRPLTLWSRDLAVSTGSVQIYDPKNPQVYLFTSVILSPTGTHFELSLLARYFLFFKTQFRSFLLQGAVPKHLG